jgi:hypothetical protein
MRNLIEKNQMKPFLLNFEERIISVQTPSLDCGAGSQDGSTVSAGKDLTIVAGTKTLTEVHREAADADPHNSVERAFPT